MSFNPAFLTGDERAIIEQATDQLKQIGNVTVLLKDRLPYQQFFLLKDYLDFEVLRAVEVEKGGAKAGAYFVSLRYQSLSGKYSAGIGSDQQAYVVGRLNQSFGNIILHKETLFNKIYELFTPLEMDLEEDSAFSSEFYILSRDHGLARKFFSPKLRELLLTVPHWDLYLEVNANMLLIGNKKSIDGPALAEVVELTMDILSVTNK